MKSLDFDKDSETEVKPPATAGGSDIAAILLAAGRSRRMSGHFKPLLPFGDRTIIEACVENLRRAGIAEIIVVVGHRAGEMRKRLAHLPVRFALNEKVDSEMSESIRCGVRQIPNESEAVLIALGDQPQIPASVIREIVRAWQNKKGEKTSLVVPQWEERTGHPVLIDLKFGREKLLNLDPHRGLRALFDAHRERVRRVVVASPYVTRDIDTWPDYRALYEEVFGCLPPISENETAANER